MLVKKRRPKEGDSHLCLHRVQQLLLSGVIVHQWGKFSSIGSQYTAFERWGLH